jgi:hypothetical protein
MSGNRSELVCSKCGGKFIMCDCSLPSRVAPNQPLSDMVERVAKAISSVAWDEMRRQGFSGGWDHDELGDALARAAIAAIPSAGGVETEENLGASSGSRASHEADALAMAKRLTEPQRRLVLASDPDDITGEEGSGVPIEGAAYRVARTLHRLGLGTYSHGSPYGDLYFNNAEGLRLRAALNSTSPKGGEA